jgi:hypothetical protein
MWGQPPSAVHRAKPGKNARTPAAYTKQVKDFRSIARQFIRSLGRLFCTRLRRSNDPEKWIGEFKLFSGRGHSNGWSFDRYEAHER